MKQLIALIMFLFTISISCFGGTVIIYDKVDYDEGNGYDWINNSMCICKPGECNNCRVVILDALKTATISELSEGGWKITTNISDLSFKTIGISPSQNVTSNNTSGFKFSKFFYLKVKNCNEYPELVNIEIKLEGYIIDNNENLTVYVPPMN
jgi:hypothetical protein